MSANHQSSLYKFFSLLQFLTTHTLHCLMLNLVIFYCILAIVNMSIDMALSKDMYNNLHDEINVF